jgi:hypothetical protein
MNDYIVKTCSKCKRAKRLEDFNKDKSSKDGHKSNCRDCQREQKRKRLLRINPNAAEGSGHRAPIRATQESTPKAYYCEICGLTIISSKNPASHKSGIQDHLLRELREIDNA